MMLDEIAGIEIALVGEQGRVVDVKVADVRATAC